MNKNILWKENLNAALPLARKQDKPVLIDWSDLPSCVGCLSLESTTYPNEEVSNYINKHFVPVQINQRESLDEFNKHRIIWTPTITICDTNGSELERWVGYLPPEEFLPRIKFAYAKAAMLSGDYKSAIESFNEIILIHPSSFVVADVIYWLGIAKWKESKNFDDLQESWAVLKNRHPQSEASIKASCLF